MKLEYEFQAGPSSYDDEHDEEYFDTETFIFDASYKQVKNAVVDIVFNDYFKDFFKDKTKKEEFKSKITSFITDIDDKDVLEEIFEEKLHDYFESDAFESFKNSIN